MVTVVLVKWSRSSKLLWRPDLKINNHNSYFVGYLRLRCICNHAHRISWCHGGSFDMIWRCSRSSKLLWRPDLKIYSHNSHVVGYLNLRCISNHAHRISWVHEGSFEMIWRCSRSSKLLWRPDLKIYSHNSHIVGYFRLRCIFNHTHRISWCHCGSFEMIRSKLLWRPYLIIFSHNSHIVGYLRLRCISNHAHRISWCHGGSFEMIWRCSRSSKLLWRTDLKFYSHNSHIVGYLRLRCISKHSHRISWCHSGSFEIFWRCSRSSKLLCRPDLMILKSWNSTSMTWYAQQA